MEDRFKDPKHIKWAKAVKERDNYMCQICGAVDVYLNSHHQDSWDFFVDERFNLNNGVTMCSKHHQLFHTIYGFSMNTRFQFQEYSELIKIIIKIAETDDS